MPVALFPAVPADLGALLQNLPCITGVTGHVVQSRFTDGGTVQVQPDAGHHHFDIFFLKAGYGAVVTGRSAFSQCSYQVFVHSIFGLDETCLGLYPSALTMFYIFNVDFYKFGARGLCLTYPQVRLDAMTTVAGQTAGTSLATSKG